MDPFNHRIRKKLSEHPHLPPDQRVWDQISSGLVPHHRPTVGVAIAVAALLMVAVASYWLGYQYADHGQEDTEISASSDHRAPMITPEIDTVWLRDTIIKYITEPSQEFQHAVVSEMITLDDQLSLFAKKTDRRTIDTDDSKSSDTPELVIKTSDTAAGPIQQNPREHSYRWQGALAALRVKFQLLPSAPTPGLTQYYGLRAEDIIKLEKRRLWWQYAIPKQIKLGILAGGLNIVKEDHDHSSERIVGITSDFVFSSRISLRTGLRFREYNTEYEEEEDIDLPITINLAAGERIHEVKEKRTYTTIPLLVNYAFLNRSRWQPYLEGGLIIGKLNKQDFSIEIKDSHGGERDVKERARGYSWRTTGYLVGGGITFNISPRYEAMFGVEGRYSSVEREDDLKLTDHGVGLRVSLRYNL